MCSDIYSSNTRNILEYTEIRKRSQNEELNFIFGYISKKSQENEFSNFVQLKGIKVATEVAVDKYR